MAEVDKKLSEMQQATGTRSSGDLEYLAVVDQSSASGYSSRKISSIDKAQTYLNTFLFPLLLNTTSKSIIGAINEIHAAALTLILTGTTAPTSSQGEDGNLYVQYTEGTGGVSDRVDAMYVKLDGVWCEVSTGSGGGGTANMTELTQAEYDALERAGELEEDMMYFITDGQSGGGVIIDDYTTSSSSVWSSSKTDIEISEVAHDLSSLGADVSLLDDRVDDLENHPTGTSSALDTNGTYQIPSDVMACPLIVITVRRWARIATEIVPRSIITNGDATTGIMFISNYENGTLSYWKLGISTTGLITMLERSGGQAPEGIIQVFGMR